MRGQVEPLAALVAVFAVGVALSAYAGVVADALPNPDRNVAGPTAERVRSAVERAGVVRPGRLPSGLRAAPDGYRTNLTLAVGGRAWHAGPSPPESVAASGRADESARPDVAARTVSVRVAPGRIRPGRLRVVVWT
ncbi:hypothetical protein NGM07_18460 [Halorussus vallis]|uniref:DUF7285 family protein n=1 Tax=Halorussus vallis TaxID=2953749 RepID=UPI00209EED79|nr:hypothetical protein [Halorussus vallis]USZ75402.1 hypothetical protein NGM07_18460 [Halorussus vallis]